jgi:outer membrane protein
MEKAVDSLLKCLDIRKVAVVLVCVGVSALAYADGIKIGFVRTDRIMREARPAKAATSRLDSEFTRREMEMRDTQSRIKSMTAALEKDMPVLAESERIKRQRELADYGQEFQSKSRRFREDYMQRSNEERSKVYERVDKVIQKIAAAEKFDLILQDAVYVSPSIDITEKVLKALDK